jgi:hypothetical protein
VANIIEYNAPIRPTTVNEAGEQARAREGLHIESIYGRTGEEFGRGLGAVLGSTQQAYVEHRDSQLTSQALSLMAQNSANFTKQWNDYLKTQDPHDPNIAARFAQQFGASLDKQGEAFAGSDKVQKIWQEGRFRLAEHMNDVMSTDMAHMAGIAAQTDLHDTLNHLGAMAAMDPTSLAYAKKTFQASVDGIVANSPNLTAEQSAKLKETATSSGLEQIEKAHFGSLVVKNPNLAEQYLKSGAYENLNPGEVASAVHNVRTIQNQDARMARMEARENLRDQQDAAAAQVMKVIGSGQPQPPGFLQSIYQNMPKLGKENTEFLIRQALNPEAPSNAAAELDARTKMLLPDGDPNKINSASQLMSYGLEHGMSKGQIAQLMPELRPDTIEKKSELEIIQGSMALAKSVFMPPNNAYGGVAAGGVQAFNMFSDRLNAMLNSQLNDDMGPQARLAKLQDLLTPDSPNYVLRNLIQGVARDSNFNLGDDQGFNATLPPVLPVLRNPTKTNPELLAIPGRQEPIIPPASEIQDPEKRVGAIRALWGKFLSTPPVENQ